MAARRLVPDHDVVLVTLDTLRFDVAQQAHVAGQTPELSALLPATGWECRHSPGSFTYAAHQAFFAGFLPTPTSPGPHPRLFAIEFPGSTTTTDETLVFQSPDIVSGFAQLGYHTLCVGGVGFFNPVSPLGRILPGLFRESFWSPAFGVTDPESTRHQVDWALARVASLPPSQPLFLFLNVSACHQPNCIFLPGATVDSCASMAAALTYADRHLGHLLRQLRQRRPLLTLLTADHGTAYGEDGYWGHRLAHRVVWDVPYAELVLSRREDST